MAILAPAMVRIESTGLEKFYHQVPLPQFYRVGTARFHPEIHKSSGD
jgi:hypothetical protein